MSDSRVKKTTYNVVMGFMNQFITLILSFVSRSVFIHTLGEEYLGLNSVFADVLNLLSLADLGFGTAMAYSFYQPLADGNKEHLSGLICFYKRLYAVIAIVVSCVGVALIPFLDFIVNTERDIPHLEIYYVLALAGVVSSYLFVYKTTILTADQRGYEISKVTIWTNIVKSLLQIICLYITHNYILYLIINVATQFINNALASKKAEKLYPYINDKVELDKAEHKSIWNNMKSVFVYKLSGTLFNATDNLLISVIIGTAMVGLYSNYLMVSQKLLLIMQIIFSAVTAGIGNVVAKENEKKRYEVFEASQSVSFIFCGIITSVFCVMANDLVTVWLGEAYKITFDTVCAITLNTYLACVLQPLWSYRDATGLYLKTKYIMLAGALLNIVLSIILGKAIGLSGIIFASALARLCTYFWYEPKLLFKEYFGRSPRSYYFSLLKNFCVVVLCIAVLLKLTQGIMVDSWGMLLLKGSFVGGVSVIVFIGVYIRSSGCKVILNKVKKIKG